MQPPEHDHVIFISKWAQEIISAMIFILLVVMKFIGSRLGGKNVTYATSSELKSCATDVGGRLDKLGADLVTLDGRIDDIYKLMVKKG